MPKPTGMDFSLDVAASYDAFNACDDISEHLVSIVGYVNKLSEQIDSVNENCATHYYEGGYYIAVFCEFFNDLFTKYSNLLNMMMSTDSHFATAFNFFYYSDGKVDEDWLADATPMELNKAYGEFITIWSYCNALGIPCEYLSYEDMEINDPHMFLDVLEYVDVQMYLSKKGFSSETAAKIMCAADIKKYLCQQTHFNYYSDYMLNTDSYGYISHCREILEFCEATPGVYLSKPGINTFNDLPDSTKVQFLAWSSLNSDEYQALIEDCGYGNVKTWASLDVAIADISSKIDDINSQLAQLNSMCDEGTAIIQFIYHIQNDWSGVCTNVDKVAKQFNVGYTYATSSGDTVFSYICPSMGDMSIDYSTVQPVNFYDTFGHTQLYKDLAKKINDNPWYATDFYDSDDGLYERALKISQDRKDQVAALEAERDSLIIAKNTLEDLKTTIPESANNYFQMEMSWTYCEGYSEYSTENQETTEIVVNNIMALFDRTSYYSIGEDDYMYLNNNENVYMEEMNGNYYLTIGDQNMLNDVLYSVVTGNAVLEYDENYIRFHMPGAADGVYCYIESYDPMLEDFIKWAPLMTDGEKAAYLYNWNMHGADAATNYLDSFSSVWDKRYVQEQKMIDAQYATEHPVLASLQSVFLTPGEGLMAAMHTLDSLVSGDPIRQSHVYSSGDFMRSTVASNIESPAWSFLYSTGMSMADSALLLAMNFATMGSMTPFLSVTLMGSRAYVSTLNDALDRGLSDGQAVALAFASAAAESVCESFSVGSLMNLDSSLNSVLGDFLSSIDNPALKKTFKVLGSAAIQGLNEGQEELCTEVLNGLMDSLISGDLSNYNLAIEKYVSDGYSTEEAIAMASRENIKQLELAFLGGFISGGANGGIFTAVGVARNDIHVNQIANNIMNEFNIGEFNVDLKSVRLNLRNGNYTDAVSSVFDSSSLDLSSQLIAANALYDSIKNTGEITAEQDTAIKTKLDYKLNEFLNLELNQQVKQFAALDVENKVYLYTKLDSQSFLNLFNNLDSDAQQEFLNLLQKYSVKNDTSTESFAKIQAQLDSLNYGQTSVPQYVADYLASNVRKFAYKNTDAFEGLNESIMQNGLYHFTDAADVIIESGYIKSSNMNASYGNRKTFFFNGVPDVGAFATNLDSVPVKTVAVKVKPTSELLESSKLKVRYIDDMAITYDGNFDLTGFEVEKCYFGLVIDNGKLVYKQISESEYNSYENTDIAKALAGYVSDKNNIKNIKADFFAEISERNKSNNKANDSGTNHDVVKKDGTITNDQVQQLFNNFVGDNLGSWVANKEAATSLYVNLLDACQNANISLSDVKNCIDVLDSMSKYYEDAKNLDVAEKGEIFNTYRTHGIVHIFDVLTQSINAYASFNNAGITNLSIDTIMLTALMHDTGMSGGQQIHLSLDAAENLVIETKDIDSNGNTYRESHSFNSAVNILNEFEALRTAGYTDLQIAEAALLTFAHSKSNSGLNPLSGNISGWSFAIQALAKATEGSNFNIIDVLVANGKLTSADFVGYDSVNAKTPTEKLTGNVGVFDINGDWLNTMSYEGLIVRLGDALTNNDNAGTNQYGKGITFKTTDYNAQKIFSDVFKELGIDSTLSFDEQFAILMTTEGLGLGKAAGEEAGNIVYEIDGKEATGSQQFVLGENNQLYDIRVAADGSIEVVVTVKHSEAVPLCTLFAIDERLQELNSKGSGIFGQSDSKNIKMVIEIDSTTTDSVKDLFQQYANFTKSQGSVAVEIAEVNNLAKISDPAIIEAGLKNGTITTSQIMNVFGFLDSNLQIQIVKFLSNEQKLLIAKNPTLYNIDANSYIKTVDFTDSRGLTYKVKNGRLKIDINWPLYGGIKLSSVKSFVDVFGQTKFLKLDRVCSGEYGTSGGTFALIPSDRPIYTTSERSILNNMNSSINTYYQMELDTQKYITFCDYAYEISLYAKQNNINPYEYDAIIDSKINELSSKLGISLDGDPSLLIDAIFGEWSSYNADMAKRPDIYDVQADTNIAAKYGYSGIAEQWLSESGEQIATGGALQLNLRTGMTTLINLGIINYVNQMDFMSEVKN